MSTTSKSLNAPAAEPRAPNLGRLPWWALALAGLGVLMVYLVFSNQNYNDTFMYLQLGVMATLRMTLIAFPVATLIGLFVGLARISKNVVLNNLATMYVETVRGIPLIVIILYFAFGVVPVARDMLNAFGNWGASWAAGTFLGGLFAGLQNFSIRDISMEMRAIIALAVGYGAFEAEVFRAGIQSISRGQMEAARSLGMSYIQAMRYIILPQAIRRVLPPLGNDFIALLKDTSLATVLAVPELTQMGRLRRASTFRYLETFNVVAFLYLAMTLLLSAGVRSLERFLKYED